MQNTIQRTSLESLDIANMVVTIEFTPKLPGEGGGDGARLNYIFYTKSIKTNMQMPLYIGRYNYCCMVGVVFTYVCTYVCIHFKLFTATGISFWYQRQLTN